MFESAERRWMVSWILPSTGGPSIAHCPVTAVSCAAAMAQPSTAIAA